MRTNGTQKKGGYGSVNVRPLPVLLAFLVTAGLLFGGYFVYQAYAVQQPMESGIAGVEGVSAVSLETERGLVTIRLRLRPEADLMRVYRQVETLAAGRAGGRNIAVVVETEAGGDLEAVWQEMLFDLAEAMENRRYGDIPGLMEAAERRHPGLSAEAAMDESRVYVTLRLDGAAMHKALPLAGGRLEAWANGPVR